MRKHVHDSLRLESLSKTSVVIQLASGTFVYPLGVMEYVLVKVDDLFFPCDFYVLDMGYDSPHASTPILWEDYF